ncbi:MAG: hypothetical protein OXN44_01195, partial [Acidimicrobiaceae bacterium]|nr:hypothetical protein [Acidimicrobiaceae bacterium]
NTPTDTTPANHLFARALSEITGVDGRPVHYQDLRVRATLAPITELRIPVASLDDIITSKKSSNRTKDREALPELDQLRQRLQGGDGDR